MDLTGHGSPSGGAGGRVGAGGISGWHEAAAGGVLGGVMGMGRGFVPYLGGAFAVAQLSNMSQQMQGQRAAMTAVTGSQTAGGVKQWDAYAAWPMKLVSAGVMLLHSLLR